MKKKGILSIAYHQGRVIKKFQDQEKFVKLVSQLGIHKTAIIFKINVFKLCEKYKDVLNVIIRPLKQSPRKMNASFYNYLLFFRAFLFFKIKLVTQLLVISYASKNLKVFLCVQISTY